ncbi:beta-N-acetylhexosaminidase [Paenibacillus timonensis]|uniref:Beta-N-acetylhexosaminidase n=1 Tax=Paenibacillus timonensis TaxID=225915 RepID=A0ABW3SIK7_9BACL|nr:MULTISPECIES: beta-N-acetylhexosaminidase [Paenibacillus]MCH1643175.1 beta-N-acetylhexosaminidase [Paenibacillus timonensis]MDU2240653.1 beta-N-acetylhexosaminidase [Paenibacillus sp.]
MKLYFQGWDEELVHGVKELETQLGFQADPAGLPVEVVRLPRDAGQLRVSLGGGKGRIEYVEKIHFFRALGLLVERAKTSDAFELTELPSFDYNGAMLDASRNAVMRVDAIKQMLRYMAVMGLNGLMMYTEDTYEVPELPYFGYMRGRYTAEELRECDDYAALFGIEMIPCIQTLGHLFHALKWLYAEPLRDHPDIVLPGTPATYEFLEQTIRAAAAPFRSKRIHIGMDEAFQVGLGRYLRDNGFRDRFEVMNEHVGRVMEITGKLGLEPMIWSDMYFNLLSNDVQGGLYNMEADFSAENMAKIPDGLRFVYWNYWGTDENAYKEVFDKHRLLGSEPIFAGGIHMWNLMAPNHGKTWSSMHPALRAAKRSGLREVFATAWGDNGNEANHFVILPGLQLFAEYGYHDGEVSDEHLQKRLAACTGLDLFGPLEALKGMDEVPEVHEGNYYGANPSKFLLWQDLLIGLFDKHVEGMEGTLPDYYAGLVEKWRGYGEGEGSGLTEPFTAMFVFYEKLAAALSVKSTLGVTIKRLYDAGDRDGLRRIADETLPELRRRVEELRVAHRELWLGTYKPFGWEVLDIRYGGVLSRAASARDRLLDYANGRVLKLEELEAERLVFNQNNVFGTLDVNGLYHQIATAGSLSM